MDNFKIQSFVKNSAERVRVLNMIEKSRLERENKLINIEKRGTIKNWGKEQASFSFYLNQLENSISKIRSYLTKQEIENFTNQETGSLNSGNTKLLKLPKINTSNRINNTDNTLNEEELRQKYLNILNNLRNIRHETKEYIEDIIYLEKCYENLVQCLERMKDQKDKKVF